LVAGLRCDGMVQIIGHRGAASDAPENTLVSAKTAWKQGADAVEIDIHLSKDGRVMVSHDASTLRTSGIDLKISDATSDELRKLDVGKYKGSRFKGEKIPFLEEIIEAMPAKRGLFIEIKCGTEVLKPLYKVITESGKMDQITIIGFNLETMASAKAFFPTIPVYWLRGTDSDPATGKVIPHDPKLIEQIKKMKLDGLDMHFAGVTTEFVNAIRAAGMKLHTWTVDDPAEAIRLYQLNVDGITTNCPGKISKELNAQNE